MADIKKLKKRLGDQFEPKIAEGAKRLVEISKEIESDPSQPTLPIVLKPEAIEENIGSLTESLIERERAEPGTEAAFDPMGFPGIAEEAIVEILNFETRPPLIIAEDKIILDGSFGIVNQYEHGQFLEGQNLLNIEKIAASVGAVDLINSQRTDYVGTGWLIAEDIAVTNRHVAHEFMEHGDFGGWSPKQTFHMGHAAGPLRAGINFNRQHETPGRKIVRITEPLYIASEFEPDMAFFRVEKNAAAQPLVMDEETPNAGLPVAVIGYPAWDGIRNDRDGIMTKLFGGIYGVKRISPGEVDLINRGGFVVHDCSTLGGNSGSPVINLDNGKVVGLHFAGLYGEENRAVSAEIVWAALREIQGRQVRGADIAQPESGTRQKPKKTPVRSRGSLKNRDGYNPDFLGAGKLRVPVPGFGDHDGDLSPVENDGGNELKYHHFSVFQSASRKLPRMTAVNIFGEKLGKVPSSNSWHFDPRISLDDQAGNELYKDTDVSNPLDRGHMVRRLDPCWGTKTDIKKAQQDTYHYTNSAPQHLGLNRRHWVGLEDYILDSAKARDLKVSVFTGPVFRDDDPRLSSEASDVQIPKEYWKVAALINSDSGALSAAGYILSQGEMIKGFTEAAFIFGQYETYQVPLSLIEEHTGYDFGDLKSADVLSNVDVREASFGPVFRRIGGPGDIGI